MAEPIIAFLAQGKEADRGRRAALDLWTNAWQGDTEKIDLNQTLFTSTHVFPLGPIRAFQDARDGKSADLQKSDVPHAAPALLWDIDVEGNPEEALLQGETLIKHLMQTFGFTFEDDLIRANLSGSKGAHIRLVNPLFNWANPEYEVGTNAVHKRLATQLAEEAGVKVDESVYCVGSLIRLPNSRHPKSGRHATPIMTSWLVKHEHLAILDPTATEWTDSSKPIRTQRLGWPITQFPAGYRDAFAARWEEAKLSKAEVDVERTEAAAKVRGVYTGKPVFRPNEEVQRVLLNGILNAREGEGRRNELYRAAANLAERGIPLNAVYGLLREAAHNSNITEKDIKHNLRSGWQRGWANRLPGWDSEEFMTEGTAP